MKGWGHANLALSRVVEIISGLGFERIDSKGLIEFKPATNQAQIGEPSEFIVPPRENVKTPQEHPKDTPDDFFCGARVGTKLFEELAELVRVWERIPNEIRQSWILTARVLTQDGDNADSQK